MNNLLTFNTTEHKVELIYNDGGNRLVYENVPTVSVQDGYYEIIQLKTKDDPRNRYPVLRVPISNTIMKIEK